MDTILRIGRCEFFDYVQPSIKLVKNMKQSVNSTPLRCMVSRLPWPYGINRFMHIIKVRMYDNYTKLAKCTPFLYLITWMKPTIDCEYQMLNGMFITPFEHSWISTINNDRSPTDMNHNAATVMYMYNRPLDNRSRLQSTDDLPRRLKCSKLHI